MKSVRTSLVLSLAQRYASFMIGLASTVVLSRLLTPAEIGIFSVCAALVAIASVLRDFGVSEYLIQEKQLTRDKLRTAFSVAIVVAWTLALTLFLSRQLLADFYGEPGLSRVLAVLCLNFIILPFASPTHAILTRDMAFDALMAIQTAAQIVQAGLAVLLAWLGYSYMSLAWSSLAMTLTHVLMQAYFRPRDAWLLPGLREWRVVWSYGTAATAASMLAETSRRAHEFIVSRYFGFAALGFFNRGLGILEQFHSNFTQAVTRVAMPAFARIEREGAVLRLLYGRALSIYTVFAWPFFGFVALQSENIVLLLFGPQWTAAAALTRLLCVSAAVSALSAFAPTILSATGNARRKFRVEILAMPTHILILVLAASMSLEAVAIGVAVSALVALALYSQALRVVIDWRVADLVRASAKSALTGGISTGFVYLATRASEYFAWGTFLSLLWTAVWMVVGWGIAIVVLNHPFKGELIDAWGHARRAGVRVWHLLGALFHTER